MKTRLQKKNITVKRETNDIVSYLRLDGVKVSKEAKDFISKSLSIAFASGENAQLSAIVNGHA